MPAALKYDFKIIFFRKIFSQLSKKSTIILMLNNMQSKDCTKYNQLTRYASHSLKGNLSHSIK